jgi:tetratricopeptide (TPR) repeat protein
MSEEAERELALAYKRLAEADVEHAAAHFARAIAADPSMPDAYEQLELLSAGVGEFGDLFPPGDQPNAAGVVAARAYIAARNGDPQQALTDIIAVTLHEPAKPWTETAWWPDLATALSPRPAGLLLAEMADELPTPRDNAHFAPFLALARDLTDQHPADIELAVRVSGLARALGANGDASRWCARAEGLTPGPLGSIMLGFALRDAGRYSETEAAWMHAIDADPDNIDVYVDLATTLIQQDRATEGKRWLGRALSRDPAHVGARSMRHALRFADNTEIRHLIALVDEARDVNAVEGAYSQVALTALATACDGKMWLSRVPMPTEAVATSANQFGRDQADGSAKLITKWAVTAIEPASAVAAAAPVMVPGTEIDFAACPPPDLRVPLVESAYRIWRYEGTTAIPAVPEPSEQAAALLRTVANLSWTQPIGAYEHAAAFAGTSLDDLLGLLGHIPAAPANPRWEHLNSRTITYWPRLAAAWICLGILYHQPDQPWATSTRREVLVALVNGVEDWVTDSALFALVVAAWAAPESRADVLGIVRARLAAAGRTRIRRMMSIAPSIAELALITPGMTMQDSRRASRLILFATKPNQNRIGYLWRSLQIRVGR